MTTQIRKAVISSFGTRDDVSSLSVVTADIAPPASGEVQVQIAYSCFGGADTAMRLGSYPMQRSAPLTPGYCFVGRIKSLGPKCRASAVGELVAGVTAYDSEAELINVKETLLLRVPETLSDDAHMQQIAGIALDWSTAYGMVARAVDVQAGQRVFVHGMSGSVGYGILTLCLARGATVYGTASARNHESLTKLGAIPFDYRDKGWISAMQALGGADAVFDPLGFHSWDESWSILSRKGHLVGYGGNEGTLNNSDGKLKSPFPAMGKLIMRGMMPCQSKRTTFYYIDPTGRHYQPDFAAVIKMLSEGAIEVPIKKVWELTTESLREAHQSWGKLPGMGSMVVRVQAQKGLMADRKR